MGFRVIPLTTGEQGVHLLPHPCASQASTGTESSAGHGEMGLPKADGGRKAQLNSREVLVLEKLQEITQGWFWAPQLSLLPPGSCSVLNVTNPSSTSPGRTWSRFKAKTSPLSPGLLWGVTGTSQTFAQQMDFGGICTADGSLETTPENGPST